MIQQKTKAFAATLICAPLTLACGGNPSTAESTAAPAATRIAGVQDNREITPANDLFRYANNEWIAANMGRLDSMDFWASYISGQDNKLAGGEMGLRSAQVMREILEAPTSGSAAPTGSPGQKIGYFYRTCLDTTNIKKDSLAPVAPEFARIDAMATADSLPALLGRLHRAGFEALFDISIDRDAAGLVHVQVAAGGLSAPVAKYADGQRGPFERHVARQIAQTMPNDSGAIAAIVDVETALAVATPSVGDSAVLALDALRDSFPNFMWQSYFNALGLAPPNSVYIRDLGFFHAADSLLQAYPVASWQAYLKWHVLRGAALGLSPDITKEYEFLPANRDLPVTAQITSRTGRKSYCVAATRMLLKATVDRAYVDRVFDESARRQAREMVRHVRSAFRQRLEAEPWLTDAGRRVATTKLDSMTVYFGAPPDDASLKIGPDSFGRNLLRARAFAAGVLLEKIGTVDKTEWNLPIDMASARYIYTLNAVRIQPGMMQPPFFDAAGGLAANYGAAGASIGHEMGHGFDREGIWDDGTPGPGRLLGMAERDSFDYRVQRLHRQFDGYVAIDSLHVHLNGEITLNENIADLTGLTIAYEGLMKAVSAGGIDDSLGRVTARREFFMSWAQSQRAVMRDAYLHRMIEGDNVPAVVSTHTPFRFRVIGPLSNMDEFIEVFGVKPGDGMYRPPERRIVIW